MRKFYILLVVCVMLFASCTGRGAGRFVHGNAFYSMYTPKLEVLVSPSMPFIEGGERSGMGSDSDEPHTVVSVRKPWWLFGELSRYGEAPLYVKRGVLIEVEELPRTSNWAFHSDLLAGYRNKLHQGSEEILGKTHNWALIAPSWPFTKTQNSILEKAGYRLPYPCVMHIMICKLSSTSMYSVTYFESMEDNAAFFNKERALDARDAWNSKYMTEFLKRMKKAYEILPLNLEDAARPLPQESELPSVDPPPPPSSGDFAPPSSEEA
ncbi:hypothetical protein SAMN02745216_04071 [Desulfatibacillum alkenivorans DSM 16219]|uniref:Lipoprotein n=1 Tax=Desulfatibacillum alkenivorans DSM 16219 TaxID=1121393 RepID=A0A1M6V931_9BACT|nr:hypothetical protein [Desulfatibacillum alkenivorans]SHK77864.1 hypothetical protein SAMN02745216_04071 [Desulfatibacillum alkenivorans DSM 16219]